MRRGIPLRLVVALVVLIGFASALVLTLGGDDTAAAPEIPDDWAAVADAADGQTVRLWMWGGEAALNAYIDDVVTPAAADLGVDLERVPIDDTATAMDRLVAGADAGEDDGDIDLLWVNGKNFAQGTEGGLWLDDWVRRLPNASLLAADDPSLWSDFGVPTGGREMPWSRAAFVFAADTARVDTPPRSFPELLAYAKAHPGRLAYPAPPDFTGSAFVRQAMQALGEDQAFALLAELDPYLWRSGETYPVDQAEIEQLFAAGEIDLAMSYNPNFVDVAVGRGSFPATVEPYVFDGGTLQNVSFLAIPVSAPSPEGALVVANLMLSVELQAAKLELVGIPSVLPGDALPAGSASTHRLVDYGTVLEELPVDAVTAVDQRWIEELARSAP
ncbi:MAG: ABC transporter substrate-binding protein [Ilumatobacteraceae bacterium]